MKELFSNEFTHQVWLLWETKAKRKALREERLIQQIEETGLSDWLENHERLGTIEKVDTPEIKPLSSTGKLHDKITNEPEPEGNDDVRIVIRQESARHEEDKAVNIFTSA